MSGVDDRLEALAWVVQNDADAILAEWRSHVYRLPSAERLDAPSVDDHVPVMLRDLAHRLRAAESPPAADPVIERSSSAHGHERFRHGFDLQEVFTEYSVLRDCLCRAAERHGIVLAGKPMLILNRVVDRAIAAAVAAYTAEQVGEIRRRREEYLAFVAHDLRTPLNVIALAADVLDVELPEIPTRPDAARMFEALRRNIGHLEGLVERVIKENSGLMAERQMHRRPVDLWPFVEALRRDLAPMAATSHTRVLNIVPDGIGVHADADMLRRILENLVVNAIKHAPGTQVAIGARPSDRGVECWVADDGEGIPADRIAHVFDKLTTDAKGEGHGLGLAIVKTFVEAHGGAVAVESAEGRGAKLTFTLPAA